MKLNYILSGIAASALLATTPSLLADEAGAAQKTTGITLAQAAPAPPSPQLAPPTPGQPQSDPLVWDSDKKEVTVKSGEPQAHFTFNLTNVSPNAVTINSVNTSCGCTVAQLPSQPWTLVPGTNGQINVTMNLAGKSGSVVKTVSVNFPDRAAKVLYVTTTITPPPAAN